MKNNERNIGYYLQRARWDCDKSQEFMAIELGIARKTVQNWERGVSEPTLDQFKEWFEALKLNPMPYLLKYFYNESDESDNADNQKTRKYLAEMIMDMPAKSVSQFLYIMNGDHGSSSKALLQMMIAHIQTPMRYRYNQASLIFENYELAKEMDELTDNTKPQPDEIFLKKAIEKGRMAAVTRNAEYSII